MNEDRINKFAAVYQDVLGITCKDIEIENLYEQNINLLKENLKNNNYAHNTRAMRIACKRLNLRRLDRATINNYLSGKELNRCHK